MFVTNSSFTSLTITSPSLTGHALVAYRGRFAPSPTGPLHAGSLATALASRLDAMIHNGQWLVRIEDLDRARNVPGAAEGILATLAALGFAWDEPPQWQSARLGVYEKAFAQLQQSGVVFPCACSRKELADSVTLCTNRTSSQVLARPPAAVYPGTCRLGLPPGKAARAWRIRVPEISIGFHDAWFGERRQDVAREVGDFVLKRADGVWAYQLACVVDDGEQGVTDVVRGADLIDSTPRQILLQRCLGLPTPRYLHVPVVATESGEKLSKQTGAQAVDSSRPLEALHTAADHLGLGVQPQTNLVRFWEYAAQAWQRRLERPHSLG